MLRRDLLQAAQRRHAACGRLPSAGALATSSLIDPAMRPHYRDVRDHLRRAQERIDTLRETLAFAFEASLMNAQMQQTDISRRLAAWAAILAVPTAIAGIYGMNFENMPELKWQYGYYTVLVSTITICVFLYWRFRKSGWL